MTLKQITLVRITDILETGADKTNVQEAKSGKGLKIDYAPKVNAKKKLGKVRAAPIVNSAEKTTAKKEVKAKKITKSVNEASAKMARKKKEATTKSTEVKKETKKKSS